MKFTIDKGTWMVALVSALLLTAATLAVSGG